MLFNSLVFVTLLVPTVVAYWATSNRNARLATLLLTSLVFYGWLHWPSVLLLATTILANYSLGRWQQRRPSRRVLAFSIVFNLSFLVWFKYAHFLTAEISRLFDLTPPLLPGGHWLPLGISFFTFQVIAYQVDVYRREVEAESNLLVFAVFKSFFAQLIAGPIVRAHELLPELRKVQPFRGDWFARGVFLFIAGLSLKMGIADVLAQFAINTFDQPLDAIAERTTSETWLGVYAYTFQLFADFWGYSTMAVGLGLLFGFELPVNFRLPYLSSSLQEFWRRWHITLSSWIRDYLYIPLGGNRRWPALTLITTMALAGIWHGAGWNFVLWGALHGVWLVAERALALQREPTNRVTRIVRTLCVFHGVTLLWVLFRARSLSIAAALWQRMLAPPYSFNPRVPEVLAAWLVGFALLMVPIARAVLDENFTQRPVRTQLAITVGLALLALAYGGATFDFIYFSF